MKQEKAVFLNYPLHLFLFFTSLLLIIIAVFNKTPSKQVAGKSF